VITKDICLFLPRLDPPPIIPYYPAEKQDLHRARLPHMALLTMVLLQANLTLPQSIRRYSRL